jgi:hypothetical protein
MKCARPFIVLLVLAACSTRDSNRSEATDTASAPASSLTGTGHEPTANDIADYKLDMDKMRKYAAAMKGFSVLAKTDSAAAGAMGTHPNETTAQTIARIESSPAALKVLRDVGLSPKDFVWITAAWLQAAMTQAVLESSKDAKLPEGQNAQNIEFLRAHRAELEAMTRDFEQQ